MRLPSIAVSILSYHKWGEKLSGSLRRMGLLFTRIEQYNVPVHLLLENFGDRQLNSVGVQRVC
jgi:hypothetical protein